MKKSLFYIILLAMLMSSCTTTIPEKTNAEEPANTEAISPELTDADGSHPSNDSPSTTVEYPKSYQDAPFAYKTVLDALFLLEEILTRDEDISGEELGTVGFMEPPYPFDEKLGYAVVDINDDGIPELLLGTINGLNSAKLNSIYTLRDGEPVLLKSFWSRSRGVISADGVIYSVGSGGAAYTYLSSYRLDKNANTLTQLTAMSSDYSVSEGKPYYVQVVNGETHYIPEDEFWDFCESYENPSNKMKLTVIPISS